MNLITIISGAILLRTGTPLTLYLGHISRLLFKFRSGTHGLNEELGRHSGRNGRTKCVLCGNECESVVHALWECPITRIVGKSS